MPRTNLVLGSASERLAAVTDDAAQPRSESVPVVLLDALPFRREAVQRMLQRCLPEHEVVCCGCAGEVDAARRGAASLGLIVVSTGGEPLASPSLGAGLRALCADLAPVPVVVLSDREAEEDVVEAGRIGLRGLLPTSLDPDVAREVLHLVAAGGSFLPAGCLARVLDAGAGQALEPAPCDVALTPRQRDVLALLCQGKPNKVIAYALGMEESTVKVHVRHLMRKLGASNRTEVLLRAQHLARAGAALEAPA